MLSLIRKNGLRVVSVLAGAGMLFWGSEAIAANQVVLKYRVLRSAVSVEELTALAETGQVSPTLAIYLRQARQDPNEIRELLNREASVNGVLLDQLLNNSLGDVALDRVSEIVYTPSRRADRQALRSALVLSANNDNRLSVIEVIRNYPTSEVYVDTERLGEAANQIVSLQRQVSRLGGLLEQIRRIPGL